MDMVPVARHDQDLEQQSFGHLNFRSTLYRFPARCDESYLTETSFSFPKWR